MQKAAAAGGSLHQAFRYIHSPPSSPQWQSKTRTSFTPTKKKAENHPLHRSH